jgi:hypothetical protein
MGMWGEGIMGHMDEAMETDGYDYFTTLLT